MRRDRVDLRVGGEIDLAARADLTALLDRLDSLAVPVDCDASGLTFADSHGLEPLVDAARHRARDGRARIVIGPASPATHRALRLIGADDLATPPAPR